MEEEEDSDNSMEEEEEEEAEEEEEQIQASSSTLPTIVSPIKEKMLFTIAEGKSTVEEGIRFLRSHGLRDNYIDKFITMKLLKQGK